MRDLPIVVIARPKAVAISVREAQMLEIAALIARNDSHNIVARLRAPCSWMVLKGPLICC